MIEKHQAYQQLRNELGAAKKRGHLSSYRLMVMQDLVERVTTLEQEVVKLKQRKKPGPKPKKSQKETII